LVSPYPTLESEHIDSFESALQNHQACLTLNNSHGAPQEGGDEKERKAVRNNAKVQCD
jgi:hypothetical protein